MPWYAERGSTHCARWHLLMVAACGPGSFLWDCWAKPAQQGCSVACLVQVVKRTPRRKLERMADGARAPSMAHGSPGAPGISALSSSLSSSLRVGSDPRYPR